MFARTCLFVAASVFAALPASSSTTHANGFCNERTSFIDQLREKFSETPVAMGLAANGTVLEVLTSAEGSWTIMVTNTMGTSCIIASGQAWQNSLERKDALKKSPGPETGGVRPSSDAPLMDERSASVSKWEW